MLRARITSKGQVTIPVAVRRQLDLQTGDDLIFSIKPDGMIKVEACKRKRLTDLFAALPATKPYPGKEPIREKVASAVSGHVLRRGKNK